MEEKNPLQVCSPLHSSPVAKMTNRSGRPTRKNIILYGPQPKSIVAQMLSEKKIISDTDVKDEIICLDDQIDDSLDSPNIASKSQEKFEDLQVHHKQFCCDFPNCNYSCKVSSNLIKHKRVHTNEKPYLCDTCCFRSNFVNSLKVHKRTHTAERPYQCEHCNYKCNSSSNLKKHCRHRHPDITNCHCSKT